ncbi:hypothetical protein [Streptomyces hiroshimensis]|uniref:Uncharacterized protein n=1 Tax=Streptomyces hiroshimensis TaxID=66424 RepID=A0ABQ2Y4V1_9ACTN|nr:hypothetical protein [Streptomyces hiroshimensis]GGX65368.1 hypothetical protein GCM10010324_07970 [Streptomyces hiroshimensis]
MTDPAHDFTVPYAERDLGEVTAAFTERTAPGGRAVIVEGRCPGCHGKTLTEFPRGVPGSGTKGVLDRLRRRPATASAADGVLAAEVLYCECGYPHPGLPDDAVFTGCGAGWRVTP